MLGRLVSRVVNWFPFHTRKHYINPLLMRWKDRETYDKKYSPEEWFDKFHNLSGSIEDDRATIAPDFGHLDAEYHYNSVENLIIDYIRKEQPELESLLDIGSGSGHWVHFYHTMFKPSSLYGTDISGVAVKNLEERFKDVSSITILQGRAGDGDFLKDQQFSVINAIGVIFHIVSDEDWEAAIKWFYEKLRPGGVLIVSGLFGLVTANVQFEPARFDSVEEYRSKDNWVCNKRVRSKRYWKKTLRAVGFGDIGFVRNYHPSHIKAPENNLLFARKG